MIQRRIDLRKGVRYGKRFIYCLYWIGESAEETGHCI